MHHDLQHHSDDLLGGFHVDTEPVGFDPGDHGSFAVDHHDHHAHDAQDHPDQHTATDSLTLHEPSRDSHHQQQIADSHPFIHGYDHDHHGHGPDGAFEPPYLAYQLQEPHHLLMAGEASGDFPAQEGPSDCAITAEIGLLKALGKDVSEEDARHLAESEGWLTEHGTSPEDIGRVLEAYGVEVESGYDRSLTDLLEALKHGQKVLVGLDAEEIWHPVRGSGGFPLELPNHPHLVSVAGCTIDDAGRTCFEINDPAVPDRAGHRVEAMDFLNAWADFGNFAVITRL